MSKDPAFLFYPGDYLRDTQTLSEKTQVAYDRIICEHMRNICISKSQLKFFTKRLSEDEIEELMFVLTKKGSGFQIQWVAESIEKRRAYSESRRKNRKKKPKEPLNNTSKTYVPHMENEDVNEDESSKKKKEIIFPWDSENFIEKWDLWKIYKKDEFGFKYKSMISEQGALKKLANLSEGQEQTAIDIIYQSIESGWKGLFKIKHDEQISQNTTGPSPEYRRKTAERLGITQSE